MSAAPREDARSVLVQHPPPPVAHRLSRLGLDPEALRLSVQTDLSRANGYARVWLCVGADRLTVVTEDDDAADGPTLLLSLPSAYRTQQGVGGGLLQAQVEGVWIDLVRYSNRRAARFEKVARKLERFLQGEPLEVHPHEDVGRRDCPRCGLPMEADEQTCGRCVTRGAVLWRMWGLLRPHRGAVTLMMGLLLVGIALDLVSPLLTRYLVDRVLPAGPGSAGLGMLRNIVMTLAAVQILRAVVNIGTGPHGSLEMQTDGEPVARGVFARRCLPVRFPDGYLSLRSTDPEGHEIELGLVRDLDPWPEEARRALRHSLGTRYLVHTILGIRELRSSDAYLHFSVDTDLGPQRFTVRQQADRVQEYGARGKILLDTFENHYLVPDVERLPDRERRLFLRYIYW